MRGDSETQAAGNGFRVVVAGGGVAGLEALLALADLAPGLADVELLSPTDEFVYRPLLVAEPFGSPAPMRLAVGPIAAEAGARHTKDALVSVEPRGREVTTSSGRTLEYDALLIALGARPVEAVPGALTFGGDEERARFAELLGALGRRGMQRLAFVIPRQVTWSIAGYELALLTAADRDARKLSGVEISLVTHETSALGLFGPAASQLVAARLDEAGIQLRTASEAERFEHGELLLAGGEPIAADAAVALPGLEVPAIPGLPQRAHGFLHTDVRMNVIGLDHVWAAGDATFFPVKQGGLAAQQADVAARAIAARAGSHTPIEPFDPVLRGLLITGGAPEFLRAPLSHRDDAVATVGQALWWPPAKIAGRYLGAYLSQTLDDESADELVDLPAPTESIADERAEHDQALEMLLAAADGDARAGEFEGALGWLELVEQLDLVIPPQYIARRDEWRRRVDPNRQADPAAKRMDPSLEGAATAISDLQRRLGWLRELEDRTEGDMGDHLARFDEGMAQLAALSRRSGIFKGRPGP